MSTINVTRQPKSIKITHPNREIVVKNRNVTINLHDGGRRGLPGPEGPPGEPGPQGDPGVGVPTGGTTGQVLAKNSNTNYDTEWLDVAGEQTYDEYIYNSSGTQSGNRYNDWDDLYVAFSTGQDGPIRITFEQNEALPTGLYNLDYVTFNGNGTISILGGLVVTLPDGFLVDGTWVNGMLDNGVGLVWEGSAPALDYTSGINLFSLNLGNAIQTVNAPFFSCHSGTLAVIKLSVGSILDNGTYEPILTESGASVFMLVGGSNAGFASNIFRGVTDPFATLILVDSPSASISLARTDANLTGTAEIILSASSTLIGYDNSTSGLSASTVKTAIDELAASPGGGAVDSVNGETGVVVLTQDDVGDGGTYKQYSDTEKTKLAGIEGGAEVNNISDSNATSLTDGNPTTLHGHPQSSITNLVSDLAAKLSLSGGTMTGILNLNRPNNTTAIYVNQTSSAESVTWRYGFYLAGNNNFIFHRSGLATEPLQLRSADNFVEIGLGLDLDYSTADRLAIIDSSKHLIAANTTTYPSLTELAFVKGVTSAIQAQINGKENTITAGTTAQYWRGDKSFQTLDKTAVGLGNVDNTSDATKNSASATLTNKTINGSNNTITNVPVPSGLSATGTPSATTYLRGDGSWATPSGGGSVATDPIWDAKGDLAGATGADTASRLAVGSNYMNLRANSSQSTGLEWSFDQDMPFSLAVNDYLLLSRFLGTGYSALSPSSSTLNSNNQAKYIPFVLSEPLKIDSMALYLVAANAGASAVLRMGIYADSNGRPGNVIQDAGSASINAGGVKTLSFTEITLAPGQYWACAVTQNLDTAGVNPTWACCAAGQNLVGEPAPAASNNMFVSLISTSISGALANSPTVSFSRSTSAQTPHIYIKRSS